MSSTPSENDPPYQRVTVYFMTGTGNSYRASQWFVDAAKQRGLETQLASLDQAQPADELHPGPGQLLGLVMPTHGFTAPWYMIKFAVHLPRGKGAHAFAAATRAGAKFGPIYTPGISGSASLLIALILALKGYSVRGIKGLDMPSNWAQVHSGFKPRSVKAIIEHTHPRALRFITRILDGKRHWWTFGTLSDLFWGLSMLAISLVYLPMGRLGFAKMFHANTKCDGCGLCEEYCPVNGVKLMGKKNPTPYWTYHCESCNRCFSFCPRQAVETSYPLLWVLNIPALIPLVPFFGWPEPLAQWVYQPLGMTIWIVGIIAFWYFLTFAGYYLFYKAIRVRLINNIFTYTNLAHLYRRYREPKTRIKQIGIRKKRGS